MSRSRNWCFTLYPQHSNIDSICEPDPEIVQYIVWQNEVAPSTGKVHIQGYVCFVNPKTMSAAKKYLGHSVHLEPRAGTHAQARDYCTKEDTRVPDTEPFIWGVEPKQGSRSDLSEVAAFAMSGVSIIQLAEEYPSHYIKYNKGLSALINLKPPQRAEPPTVTVLIGPPGSGKTRYAFDNEPDLWCSPIGNSKWYDGYDRQEAVLFDDFYGGIPYADMLRICDRYPYRVEIKGGFVWWCPKRIYITSNDPIPSWWPFKDTKAFTRRVTQVITLNKAEMDEPEGGPPTRVGKPKGHPPRQSGGARSADTDDVTVVTNDNSVYLDITGEEEV